MVVSPAQIALAVTIVAVFAIVWYLEGRGHWRSRLEARFVYGVPWGTLLTVAIVVGFYLVAQSGFRHWSEPVIFPFITWSYFYPMGQLTAGIAHGSPGHLASNMAATLAFAPLVEYAWGHYPPGRSAGRSEADVPLEARADGAGTGRNLLARPWVRALIVVPVAFLGVALVTAVFAAGPGLGFSGAVYAIAGFALVVFPLWSVVAVVATGTIATLGQALSQPVVTATIDPGAPGPPAWAGVGFQAHLLGFLIGVVLAVALLRHRDQGRSLERVFFATVLFGIAQSLWLLVWSSDGTFVRYQAVGVAMVLVLAVLVAVAAGGSDRSLLGGLVAEGHGPSRRLLGVGWLALVALGLVLGLAAAVVTGGPLGPLALGLGVISLLLAIPALPSVVRGPTGPLERRQAAVALLLVVTVLVAFPSVPLNMLVVDDTGFEDEVDATLEVEGYTIAYGEDVPSGQAPILEPEAIDEGEEDVFELNQSGLIVVDESRALWTVGVSQERLAYEGNETVEIGDVGLHEQVAVERTGWDVAGNTTAYAVDLEYDGETVRSFASDPVVATARLDGHEIAVEPTDDAFALFVTSNGSSVGETEIPAVNESTAVGDVQFDTVETDDVVKVVGTSADGDTEATVATREEYGGEWS